MRVLYLGPRTALTAYFMLCQNTEVTDHQGPVHMDATTPQYDWLVAYRYKYRVPAEVLACYPERAINVHSSFLPYNRGMYPNAWAWYDGTPHGATLHLMDATLDTGPILARFAVEFDHPEAETLASTWEDLDGISLALAIGWFVQNAARPFERYQQPPGGSYHSAAAFERVIRPLLTRGWDTPVSVLVEAGKKARGE